RRQRASGGLCLLRLHWSWSCPSNGGSGDALPGGRDVGAMAEAIAQRDVEARNRFQIAGGSQATRLHSGKAGARRQSGDAFAGFGIVARDEDRRRFTASLAAVLEHRGEDGVE